MKEKKREKKERKGVRKKERERDRVQMLAIDSGWRVYGCSLY